MGRYITTTGTANAVIRDINSNYVALVNDRILVNSSGGSFTITLPLASTLLEGDTIQIIDVGNSLASNNNSLVHKFFFFLSGLTSGIGV
jgi:hypothetical protein